MHFGLPEFVIGLAVFNLVLFGVSWHFREKLQTFQARLGIRNLTFERTSDVFIGIGLVAAFLISILFLSPQ